MKDRNIFVSLRRSLRNEYTSFLFRWNKKEVVVLVRFLDNTADHDKSTRYVECAVVFTFSLISGENKALLFYSFYLKFSLECYDRDIFPH